MIIRAFLCFCQKCLTLAARKSRKLVTVISGSSLLLWLLPQAFAWRKKYTLLTCKKGLASMLIFVLKQFFLN